MLLNLFHFLSEEKPLLKDVLRQFFASFSNLILTCFLVRFLILDLPFFERGNTPPLHTQIYTIIHTASRYFLFFLFQLGIFGRYYPGISPDKRRNLNGRNCTTATAARHYTQRKQVATKARQGQARNVWRVNGWPHVDGIGHRRGAFARLRLRGHTYIFFGERCAPAFNG